MGVVINLPVVAHCKLESARARALPHALINFPFECVAAAMDKQI